MRKIILSLILILSSFCVWGQESQPRSTTVILGELRSQIDELIESNERSVALLDEKNAMNSELMLQVSDIDTRLQKTLKDMTEATVTILVQRRILIIMSAVFGFFFVLHIAILVLKMQFGITLPYWINTLL